MATSESLRPNRKCAACGGVAVCHLVEEWSKAFVRIASSEHYRCGGCNRSFVVEPRWTLVRNILGSLLAFGLAALIVREPTTADRQVDPTIAWMFVAAGVIGVGYTVVRATVGMKNPPLAQS